jgi:DNA-binding transcriptional LysR family regulator
VPFTLAQLRCAGLVAQHGSFSEAGRRCGMSQPSVSASVSELEAALGGRLFRRTTRRVELTAFGRTLMPRISEILSDTENLSREARAVLEPNRRLLRVAFSQLIDARRLSALIEPFRHAVPDVEVVFKECDVGGLEARLDDEQVDVACGLDLADRPSRDRCLLYLDPLRFIEGGSESPARRAVVDLSEVAEHRFVLTVGTCGLAAATRALFAKARVPIKEYPGQAITYSALQEWADLGIGSALLPASRIRGDAERFPALVIDGQPILLRYEAVWLRASMDKPHLKAFVRVLRKTARKLASTASWPRSHRQSHKD